MHAASAAQPAHPFLNFQQTRALDLRGVEAPSIVLNGQRHPAGRRLDANPNRVGVRMPGAIVQRLLDHSINAGLVFVGALRLRLQKVVPHQGPGEVNFGTNVVEAMVPGQELAADRVALATNVLQNPKCANPGGSRYGQQASETNDEH